jgi:hypothetical protein
LAGEVISEAGEYAGVAVYSLESQQYRRLPDTPASDPIWLNDSQRLLIQSSDEDGILLWDSGSERVKEILSVSPDKAFSINVSHDDRWIYFGRQVSESDIWMLTSSPDS